MNPEISRRCSSCGASIRERGALFCPECGKAVPTSGQSSQTSPPDAAAMIADPPREASGKPENQARLSNPSNQNWPTVERAELQEPAVAEEKPRPVASDLAHRPTTLSARMHPGIERTKETLHRASNVARGVIEDEVKRVEKIRHVSSAVIEEASYDASLRFVLVAVGLFIVFLIILVLSKVMG